MFLRRIIRDSQITNCPIDFIIKNYITYVSPEYLNNILSTKKNANIVLNNDMSFDELRQGKLSTQARYRINNNTLKSLISNSKIIKRVYQEDIYFGTKEDKDILRLRLQGNSKNNLDLKSLIYKGQQKTRKDNNLIRPMQVLCEQEDLLKMYKDKTKIINDFKSIGVTEYQTLCKERIYLQYKDHKIKIDLYDNNRIYIELDDDSITFFNSSNKLEKVDPIVQMNSNLENNLQ